jgi:septal ring factor EnvC (AmiA/AmiB activator)
VIEWLMTGPIPNPSSTESGVNFHLNTALVTALVIGIPSVLIACGTYYLAIRAKRESAHTTKVAIDADAYKRAQALYESAIATLQEQVKNLTEELTRIREELADLRRRVSARSKRNPRA